MRFTVMKTLRMRLRRCCFQGFFFVSAGAQALSSQWPGGEGGRRTDEDKALALRRRDEAGERE